MSGWLLGLPIVNMHLSLWKSKVIFRMVTWLCKYPNCYSIFADLCLPFTLKTWISHPTPWKPFTQICFLKTRVEPYTKGERLLVRALRINFSSRGCPLRRKSASAGHCATFRKTEKETSSQHLKSFQCHKEILAILGRHVKWNACKGKKFTPRVFVFLSSIPLLPLPPPIFFFFEKTLMNALGHLLWETQENSPSYLMELSKSHNGLSTRNLTCIILFNVLSMTSWVGIIFPVSRTRKLKLREFEWLA